MRIRTLVIVGLMVVAIYSTISENYDADQAKKNTMPTYKTDARKNREFQEEKAAREQLEKEQQAQRAARREAAKRNNPPYQRYDDDDEDEETQEESHTYDKGYERGRADAMRDRRSGPECDSSAEYLTGYEAAYKRYHRDEEPKEEKEESKPLLYPGRLRR